jgi:hypothetical protein
MQKDYKALGAEIGELVAAKNAAYGDAFEKAGDFLLLLYPNGIPPEKYKDALGVVRVFDKLMRIATAKDAFGESPWRDVAGYGVIGAASAATETTPRAPAPAEPDRLTKQLENLLAMLAPK